MEKNQVCKMTFSQDEQGKEILLKDEKFQVMMEWEKPYMHACIDVLKPTGDVLEIGFGCGYSATHIQTYHPKSHTIIEYHPVVAEKARAFAKTHPHITIIEDTWQNAFKQLGVFDQIFFDDYPLESEGEAKKLEEEKMHSHELVRQGESLIHEVKSSFPHIEEIRYSDADLKELVEHVRGQEGVSSEALVRFVEDLTGRGQITQAQKEHLIAMLELKSEGKESVSKTPFYFRRSNERVLVFLQEALVSHMKVGSTFSCYLSSSVSKFEDEAFFNAIIMNPYLDYHEEWIDIEPSSNCDYYTDKEALVIRITKMG